MNILSMKKLLLSVFILIPFLCFSQENYRIFNHEVEVVPENFESVSEKFKSESKETLNLLKSYVESKSDLLKSVQEKIRKVENDRIVNSVDTTVATEFLMQMDSTDDNTIITAALKHCLSEFGYMPEFYSNVRVGELKVLAERVRIRKKHYIEDSRLLNILYESQENINKDISNAKERINDLYGKLYDEGKFRLWITVIFSLCIGGLLFFFFYFISKRSETTLVKDFLSTVNGLQFITLFCLIIAIILFGVLGVLEGRELGAILSGISGYILGKGIRLPKQTEAKGSINKDDNDSNENSQ